MECVVRFRVWLVGFVDVFPQRCAGGASLADRTSRHDVKGRDMGAGREEEVSISVLPEKASGVDGVEEPSLSAQDVGGMTVRGFWCYNPFPKRVWCTFLRTVTKKNNFVIRRRPARSLGHARAWCADETFREFGRCSRSLGGGVTRRPFFYFGYVELTACGGIVGARQYGTVSTGRSLRHAPVVDCSKLFTP